MVHFLDLLEEAEVFLGGEVGKELIVLLPSILPLWLHLHSIPFICSSQGRLDPFLASLTFHPDKSSTNQHSPFILVN